MKKRQIIVHVSDDEKELEILCKAIEAITGVDRVEAIEIEEPEEEKLFVVRLYDGFDNQWMDVSKPVPKAEADRIWNEKTKNGTEKRNYGDIDYFAVYPAGTRMIYAGGFGAHD